jgi:hypothetical protein
MGMPMAAATSIIVVSVLDVALTISCFTSSDQPELNAKYNSSSVWNLDHRNRVVVCWHQYMNTAAGAKIVYSTPTNFASDGF